MTPQEAARILIEARARGVHCPPALKGQLAKQDAYAVQMELLRRDLEAGEVLAGWKVALTSLAMQQLFDEHERAFGYLLQSAWLESGTILQAARCEEPKFEQELCVTMGETLRGPGVTIARARAAIAKVAPAIEIVEWRGVAKDDKYLVLADNAQQKHFVTGPDVSAAVGQDLSRTTLEVLVNGDVRETADGTAVLEGPEGSVAWLADTLATFGMALEAGQRVMTGSFTRQHPAVPGERFEARFSPFGSALVQVE